VIRAVWSVIVLHPNKDPERLPADSWDAALRLATAMRSAYKCQAFAVRAS
jgi:hypothetical protein